MYKKEFKEYLEKELGIIKESGLFKEERVILSSQQVRIKVSPVREVLNFCANNYLGLANNRQLIRAAKKALDEWGYGLASVRFICGTQKIHKILERKISKFLGTEDTILYSSCAAANEGLFEVLLGIEDVVISDQLNHATVIDGIRLWRMIHKRDRGDGKIEFPENRIFKHSDMKDLERHLKEVRGKRFRLIVTDGVFSMDGDVANLKEICGLSEKYNAIVMVDDSHATGFFGPGGRGTPEYCGVRDKVDIITSTLGKALGGATGGFTSGRKEFIELLRQRSRPYLFSNTVPPVIVAAGIKALDMVNPVRKDGNLDPVAHKYKTGQGAGLSNGVNSFAKLRKKLEKNTSYFREKMTESGFDIKPGVHPIVPVMLYDAKKAVKMADQLLKEGLYVIAFSFPVVPKEQARIRVQISAGHSKEDLDLAILKFRKVGRKLGVIN